MIQTPQFWILLAAAVPLFWLLRPRWRSAFLAICSAVFVATLGWANAAALLGLAVAFYALAPLGRGRRWITWGLIALAVSYLALFKLMAPQVTAGAASAPLTATRAAAQGLRWFVPLGVSYFTFKFIHYAVEVARGTICHRDAADFFAWVFLFPTFTAGPIERYDHFLAKREVRPSRAIFAAGLTRIAHGLIKKFVFAEMLLGDTFRLINDGNWLGQLRTLPTPYVWWLGVCSYLYVYLDFAGYSDVAIGASQLFGFNVMENFESPFLATNLAAFWRRWHMTLTGWCQTYVYMPVLGKTRRPNLATYAAFVVIGLWHQISVPWLFWGLYHGTGVVGYGYWSRWRRRRRGGSAPPKLTWWRAIPGIAAVTLFVSAGEIVTFGGLRTGADTLHVIEKLVFIRPPPPARVL